MRKGDRGLPGSKIYVANRIAATQSFSSKFLGSFHLQSKNAAGEKVQKSKHIQDEFVSNLDAEHLLIQESLKECGKLLVNPPSRTTIVVGEDAATVATAPSVAYQGSTAVFQRRARRTLLEIEQAEGAINGNCNEEL